MGFVNRGHTIKPCQVCSCDGAPLQGSCNTWTVLSGAPLSALNHCRRALCPALPFPVFPSRYCLARQPLRRQRRMSTTSGARPVAAITLGRSPATADVAPHVRLCATRLWQRLWEIRGISLAATRLATHIPWQQSSYLQYLLWSRRSPSTKISPRSHGNFLLKLISHRTGPAPPRFRQSSPLRLRPSPQRL